MDGVRKTTFVSVNLTDTARDALRQATLDLTTPAGRRVSMSDVLLAALHVAREHDRDLLDALTGEEHPDRRARA